MNLEITLKPAQKWKIPHFNSESNNKNIMAVYSGNI